MATQITPVNFMAAFNEGVVGSVAADMHVFDPGDIVFWDGDMPADGSNQPIPAKKWTVIDWPLQPAVDGSSDVQLKDQRQSAANPADGTTATGVIGFLHTASPVGTRGSSISRPQFYSIRSGGDTIIVHQSAITDLAGWKVFADAQNDTVWV